MLSIPCVRTAEDRLFAEPNLGQQIEIPSPPPPDLVQLSVPDSSALQIFIQNTRQQFVGFAGGSMFWRLFVGSGFAVFVGALALILLGPNGKPVNMETTEPMTQVVDQQKQPTVRSIRSAPQNSSIELTVGVHEGADGPVPAEFDDPFVAANLVAPKVVNAINFTNASKGDTSRFVHQASHHPVTESAPAWLAGTIEEAVDSPQSTRKYERSRPSHR